MKADIEAINEKVNEVSDTAYDLFLGDSDKDILIDSSEMDIDLITLGKVFKCSNSGDISGDINIGGIAGTMALEYELDPEDDLSSQIDASERRKYEVKAVVQHCTNTGAVTAKRSYVGGIAGVTSSTVRHCYAKCTLSGGSYIGGIVGSGVGEGLDGGYSNVVSSYSMVQIPEYEQFAGAISGENLGSYLENYFVSDTLAGINGMSYSGKAEPIAYDDLLARFEIPEETEETEPEETQPSWAAKKPEETEPTEETEVVEPSTLPDEFKQFTLCE